MADAPKIEWPQGQPLFEVQWRAISESLAGNGVVGASDLEVTSTANSLEIEVSTGTAYYLASEATLGTAETHTLSAGDGSNDRWDTVYFDTDTGSSGVREGTATANPEPPDIQGQELLLAVIYVPQNATDVADSNILNWRAQFSNEAEEVHYNDSNNLYNETNVADALDTLENASQITTYPLSIATDTEASAYPLANSDLSNSTVEVNAGSGLSTTNASIGLGGSATISMDTSGAITWTGQQTFDLPIELQEQGSTPSTPNSSYGLVYPKNDGFLYSLDDGGRERRIGSDVKTATVTGDFTTTYEDILFVDSSGTGGLTITLSSTSNESGHGITIIDSSSSSFSNPITITTGDGSTIDGQSSTEIAENRDQILLESDGTNWFSAGGSASVGIDTDQFNADESGAVADGNSGIVYAHQVSDGRTFEIRRAGLLLSDGQAAPTDLDLIIATLDNSGTATKRSTAIDGDGTVQATVTGDPLASYENTSGNSQTVAVLVDNGNFNSGTGSSQDIIADVQGTVV
jgi:hypothetical protein